ncbi:MAG: type II toxin-antitoxin system HipA family toxin [Pseudomonadota bacterium]
MATKQAHQKSPERLFAWMLMDTQHPRLIGQIIRQTNGDVGLQYAPSWLSTGFALSDDMPLEAQVFTPLHRNGRLPGAPGALDDARPDRWGEKVIRYLYKPGASVYDNLYFAGDERFGAIGVCPSDAAYTPFLQRTLPRLADARDLNAAVQIIESGEGELQAQQRALMGAGGSLGGAKPKAAIAIDGEEWVLKFFNGEPFDLPLAEHATMTLAHKAGIRVAHTMPVQLDAAHALAVKRFDRAGGNKRVHSISACTLLRSEVPEGMDPEFGYPQLARALRRAADPRTLDTQLRELFRRMAFNILVANTDDHEKNHALLCHISGRTMKLELSPAYDVVPTGSGALEHQFMVSETSREPSLAEAMTGAESFNLSPLDAAKEVANTISVVNTWQAHFRAVGVTESDIVEVAALVDAPDLLEQRASFTVDAYAGSGKPRRKPGGGAKAFR